jgi:hypothetical protein
VWLEIQKYLQLTPEQIFQIATGMPYRAQQEEDDV